MEFFEESLNGVEDRYYAIPDNRYRDRLLDGAEINLT